jgi:hypothetical protein
MTTSEDFVHQCIAQRGKAYVFATEDSPLDPNPASFDCSELIQWGAARVGISPIVPDGAYFQWKHCTPMSVDQGIHTRGALMFMGSGVGTGRSAIHHVVCSLGDGTTIEARGRAYGVGVFSATRGFNFAGTIPGLTYVKGQGMKVNQGGGINIGVLPGASKAAVKFVQDMLNIVRAHNKRSLIKSDGDYGNETKAAVAEFQRAWNSVPAFTHLEPGTLPVTGGADPHTLQAISISVKLILG